jgi:hypothetical protein
MTLRFRTGATERDSQPFGGVYSSPHGHSRHERTVSAANVPRRLAMTDHALPIDDVDEDTQIAQVITALQSDLGTVVAPVDLEKLAVVAYQRVAEGARVRSFLPVLAEREARHVLRELAPSDGSFA